MRNFLITLTLCVLTLTTSSVFAEGYDVSRRTERLGLSFYDGRPLYVAYIKVYPSLGRPEEHSFELERLHTGQSIEDMANSYNPDADQGHFGKDGKYSIYGYYSVETDGSLKLITDGSFANYPESAPYHWLSKYLLTYKPGVDSSDVAVDIFDALLKPLQEWLGGALGFWLTIGVVFLGWQYLRRLARGGVAIGGKSAEVEASNDDFLEGFRRRRAEKLAAEQEREKFESFQKAWGAIRELGEADAYATGEAFGLTFTDKVVKSNQILQEAWSRLSEDERRFLANEARALAWQDDLIGEKEKIYRQAAMETALSDLDGVDASSVFSNPFEDATYYDDDNGGTPF